MSSDQVHKVIKKSEMSYCSNIWYYRLLEMKSLKQYTDVIGILEIQICFTSNHQIDWLTM